jgi:hypothetical protein
VRRSDVLSSHAVEFDQLADADLVVDRIYKGGLAGNAGDDPLSRLLPGVGNQDGFRMHGRPVRDTVNLVVLYTSGAEPDWPDVLDPYTGTLPISVTIDLQAETCTTPRAGGTSC